MEATRNLCAQIPISLHDRVRQEREALGQSLSEYVSQILKEHFEGGKVTMAAIWAKSLPIPEEIHRESKRMRRKTRLSQPIPLSGQVVMVFAGSELRHRDRNDGHYPECGGQNHSGTL